MKLIIISREDFFADEANWINTLLAIDSNILLHLRKPNSNIGQVEALLKGIKPAFYSQIVLHDHFYLAYKFSLKGVHLNSRCSKCEEAIPSGEDRTAVVRYFENCSISRSCHSFEEVLQYKGRCSYVTLSPIFDSISKNGYSAAFSDKELVDASKKGVIDHKVVALGGIAPDNIAKIKEFGFGGAALLGTIWKCRSLDEVKAKLNLLLK